MKRFGTITSASIMVCSMLLAIFFAGAAMAAAPDLPANLGQYKSDATTAIAQGGSTDETFFIILADVTDSDLNDVQLEVEIIDNASSFKEVLSTCP